MAADADTGIIASTKPKFRSGTQPRTVVRHFFLRAAVAEDPGRRARKQYTPSGRVVTGCVICHEASCGTGRVPLAFLRFCRIRTDACLKPSRIVERIVRRSAAMTRTG